MQDMFIDLKSWSIQLTMVNLKVYWNVLFNPLQSFTLNHCQFLIASVTHCKTNGGDVTMEPVLYSELEGNFHAIDLTAVVAVVGCIRVGARTPQFGIICHNPFTATVHGCPTSVHRPFQDP